MKETKLVPYTHRYFLHLCRTLTPPPNLYWLITPINPALPTLKAISRLLMKSHSNVDYSSTLMGIFCLQWLDKRPVTMLQTLYNTEMVNHKTPW